MSTATLDLGGSGRPAGLIPFTRLRRPLLSGGVGLLFLVAWETLCRNGTIKPSFAPAPSTVAQTLGGMLTDPLFWTRHVAATFSGFAAGWLLAVTAGLVLGFLMGRCGPIRDTLEPLVVAFYSTPRIALIPLFIVWFGFGLQYRLVIVFMASFFSILLNVMAGVQNPDGQLVTMSRAFGASDRQLLRTVILPGAVPYILTGLRQSVVQGIIGEVIGEIFSATAGLGFIINRASKLEQVDRVFAAVIILAVTGAALNEILLRVEGRFQRWRPEPTQA